MKQLIVVIVSMGVLAPAVIASELVDQAKSEYDLQLDVYRESYQEFLLKREQFKELDSFANQEELVVTAKDMLIKRANVWWIYWQSLRTELVEANGFDAELKQELTGEIVKVQEDIKAHEKRLGDMQTREVLLNEADWLNTRDERYRDLAFRSLMHLRLARFNWALLQLEAYVPVIEENVEVQVRDPQLKAAKKRGIGEVRLLLEQSRDTLDTVIEDNLNRQIRNYENVYEDVVDELPVGYAAMRRAQSLLVELSEGTEL